MTTVATARDFHRLAEEAERRGIRVLVEPISGEHFATSSSDPTKLYRLTHYSCTCPGFTHHQRCTHHSLLIAQLGWLPEDDLEPDPEPPAAGATGAATPDPWDASTEPAPPPVPVQREATADAPEPAAATAVPDNVIRLADRAQRADALSATIDEALERLATQLSAGHTAAFLEALAFWAKFHRYSFGNVCLIRAQCPQATLVAGMRRWNELGYTIRKGERALWLWAPITKREPDPDSGELVERVVAFRPAPVWDVSQLANVEEKPLPDLTPRLPDDVEALYRATVARVTAAGMTVIEWSLPGGIAGVSQGGRILIRTGLDSRTRLFTLVHEVVHELAHHGEDQREKPRQLRELEAESVAYVVAAVLGLDNVGTRDYLLTYKVSAEDLRAALSSIQRLVRHVLAIVALEKNSRTETAAA